MGFPAEVSSGEPVRLFIMALRMGTNRLFLTPFMTTLLAKRINKIMQHDDNIIGQIKKAQRTMFRLTCSRGDALKRISMDSGLGYTTIQSYAGGHSVMSVASLYRLVGVIPDDLLSLLLPTDHQIVQAPDDIDHDALTDLCQDYVNTKASAHRADSPAGVDISPCEKDALDAKAVTLKAVGG
ncbi:hypothetical protein AB1K62_14475 [Parasphingorhabdus sp. JC815]|uniref:hypothetical protein n=1 Tax=Parasphingorhabdus sp. JC815 TaxID=3232140 RepID=UPI003459231F